MKKIIVQHDCDGERVVFFDGVRANLAQLERYILLEVGFDVNLGSFSKHYSCPKDLKKMIITVEFIKDFIKYRQKLYFEPFMSDGNGARRVELFKKLFPGLKQDGDGYVWTKTKKNMESKFRKFYCKSDYTIVEFYVDEEESLESSLDRIKNLRICW